MTSEQIFGLAGALLIAAVVAPLAKIFWDLLFQKQSRLRGVLTINAYRTPTQMRQLLKPEGTKGWVSPYLELREWAGICSFAEMSLTNASNKRINNISLMISMMGGGFYQVEDGNTEAIQNGRKIEAGDLQPGHTVKIRLWSKWDWSASYMSSIKRDFVVSADELDKVRFKYPAPEYLGRSFALLPRWIIYISAILVWLSIMIALSGISIRFK